MDVSPKQNALQKERDSNVHTQWFYLNETVKEGGLICSPIKHISSRSSGIVIDYKRDEKNLGNNENIVNF